MRYQSCRLLRKQFNELSRVEGLSLRGWCESIALSPGYVSLIFNSKRLPNLETLTKMGSHLDMDKLALSELKDAYQLDWLKKKKIKAELVRKTRTVKEDVEVTLMEDSDVFNSWLNLAIAEFTGCEAFTEDVARLAKLFSVTPQEARQSLHFLMKTGFVVRDESGRLRKRYQKVRFPVSNRSRQQMRSFHKQMMLKAIHHMQTQTDQESYSKRLINGYTVAVNPDQVEAAKVMLQQALIDIGLALTSGNCSEVYQLQVQLFPLTISGAKTNPRS